MGRLFLHLVVDIVTNVIEDRELFKMMHDLTKQETKLRNFLYEMKTYSLLSGSGVTAELAEQYPDSCPVLVRFADKKLEARLMRSGGYDVAVPLGEHKILAMANKHHGNPGDTDDNEVVETTIKILPRRKYVIFYTAVDNKFHIEDVGKIASYFDPI